MTVEVQDKVQQFADYITILRQKFTDQEAEFIQKTQCMSIQQMKILLIIAMQQPCTMGEIAKKIPMLSLSSVTVIVDKLVKQDLVERSRDDKDRRVVYVKFTEEGQKLYQVYQQCVHNLSEKLLSRLSDEEQEVAIRIYKKLAEVCI